jgi:DNA topoisomerase-2
LKLTFLGPVDPFNKTVKLMEKKSSEKEYQGLSHIEQIQLRPDMYIGAVVPSTRTLPSYDPTSRTISYKDVTTVSEGMERLFLEALSNSGDNCLYTRSLGKDPGSIDITMDNSTITVRNGGEPIPITPQPSETTATKLVTKGEFIFGRLLTSSNYDKNKQRTGGGMNGYGAKLINVLSKEFVVEIGDSDAGCEQKIVWKNGMNLVSNTIRPGYVYDKLKSKWVVNPDGKKYTAHNYVSVTWTLDFSFFGNITEYSEEAFRVFCAHLINYSFTCKVPISFNGARFDMSNIENYAEMIYGKDAVRSAITIRIMNTDTEARSRTSLANSAKYPIAEVMFVDTPDNASVYSFVNGIPTFNGGKHVDVCYASFFESLQDYLESRTRRKSDTGLSALKIRKQDITPHVSLIASFFLANPVFDTQTKTKLTNPKPNYDLSLESVFNKVRNWALIEILYSTLEKKQNKILSASDGKKNVNILSEACEDANYAKTTESEKCILYVAEGNSAAAYLHKWIQYRVLPGGTSKDYAGYMAVRGKVLNVSKADFITLSNNKELANIKKMLGLQEGVDYTIEANRKHLRYGLVVVCTDADTDGKHILGLIINFFHERFPSILKSNMVAWLSTPVIRLSDTSKRIVERFYTEDDYHAWEKKNKGHRYTIKYFKGLGTTQDEEVKDDIRHSTYTIASYDDDSVKALKIAFGSGAGHTDLRKRWIEKHRKDKNIDVTVKMNDNTTIHPISSFINKDLVTYAIASLYRAIPDYRDGLKKSQRLLVYHGLTFWNYGHAKKKERKVGVFGSEAAAALNYHHGDIGLSPTIIKLARKFAGANNLPFFRDCGQFGNRSKPEGSAPRYISVELNDWVRYAFFKGLTDIIPCHVVEGDTAEPHWVPCIIPMHIINGVNGIATGYSTFVPPHNPLDVIDYLIYFCRGAKNIPLLKPWYVDFLGKVEYTYKKSSTVRDAAKLEIDEEDKEVVENEEKNAEPSVNDELIRVVSTSGVFEVIGQNKNGTYEVDVTETPVGVSYIEYRQHLEKLREEKKIADFTDKESHCVYRMRIHGMIELPTIDSLSLRRDFFMTNMNFIDTDAMVRKYTNTAEIITDYAKDMINAFSEYRQSKIDDCRAKIEDFHYKFKLSSLIHEGKIELRGKKREENYEQLAVHGIPTSYASKINILDVDADGIEQYRVAYEKRQKILEEIESYSPQDIWASKLSVLRSIISRMGFKKADESYCKVDNIKDLKDLCPEL